MHRAPVTPSLYAPDLPATLRFYVETLGFTQTGGFEDDGKEIWAEVTLGDAHVWFFSNSLTGHAQPTFSGLIYVFVDDVDAMAQRLKDHDVAIEWGPETQAYDLREVGCKDLNGYYLVFAKDV